MAAVTAAHFLHSQLRIFHAFSDQNLSLVYCLAHTIPQAAELRDALLLNTALQNYVGPGGPLNPRRHDKAASAEMQVRAVSKSFIFSLYLQLNINREYPCSLVYSLSFSFWHCLDAM